MQLTDVLIDRISPQVWSILILESVFLLFMPQNNYLSAFHRVSAFMGLISKVYFVKFYMCISYCVRVLNVLLHNKCCVFMEKYTFSGINFFLRRFATRL